MYGRTANKWIKIVTLVVSLGVLLTIIQAECGRVRIEKLTDDEAIVNVSMRTFFDGADWTKVNWDTGRVVVLATEWRSKDRPDFEDEVKQEVNRLASVKTDKPKRERLLRALAAINTKGSFLPPPPNRLSSYRLDPSIVVGKSSGGRKGWFSNNETIKDQLGLTATVRVEGSISPPGYSRDGKYACVLMSAPWSVHSAKILFVLERVPEGWMVIEICPTFFV